MAKEFMPRWIETIRPEPGRRFAHEFPDPLLPRHYFVLQPSGAKSWAVRYRLGGIPRRFVIGPYPLLGLAKARELAREALIEADRGRDPGEQRKAARRKAESTAASTLKAVAEEYLSREGKKLRTVNQRRAILERLVYPRLGKRPIGEIKRSEIIRLLDRIEDENGPRMADVTLMIVGKIMNWHATRDDDFLSPIVRGMQRQSQKERARHRVLSDDELRAVWAAAESMGAPFGKLIQFILLTATRRGEAAHARRCEIDGDDWVIPAIRYKGKHDHVVPLSGAARAIVDALPAGEFGEWIFSSNRGVRPIADFGRDKRKIDQRSGVTGWTIHDLRRTARSLMSRAGVPSDHAERCLGHVIGGIRGVYDRHSFRAEKARAFELLAGQVERILSPVENVVPLRGARREGA
jgi:integrase